MQVGGLDKRLAVAPAARRPPRHSRARHSQRRAELHAADADAGRLKALERACRVFEFNGEMTAIETDADVLAEASRAASTLMPSRAASQAAPRWNSQRSKNSIVSLVFSSRQSGSGSMSRCSNWPLVSVNADERLGDPRDVGGDRRPILSRRARPSTACTRAARWRRRRRRHPARAAAGSRSDPGCTARAPRRASPGRRRSS